MAGQVDADIPETRQVVHQSVSPLVETLLHPSALSAPEFAFGSADRRPVETACDQQAPNPIGGDDQLPYTSENSSVDEFH
jgi:hypothetical protein